MKKYTTAIIIAVVILLASITVVGGILVNSYTNKKYEEERIAEEKFNREVEEIRNTERYYTCIDEAYDYYVESWDNACVTNGLGLDCELSWFMAQDLEDMKTKDEQTCFDLYMK